MNHNEIIGAVLVALGSLLALMGTLSKFVSQPINRLNESVIRLTTKLEHTDGNVNRVENALISTGAD